MKINIGKISETKNVNKLFHLVGYWKSNGDEYEPGIYINGVEYEQSSHTFKPEFE